MKFSLVIPACGIYPIDEPYMDAVVAAVNAPPDSASPVRLDPWVRDVCFYFFLPKNDLMKTLTGARIEVEGPYHSRGLVRPRCIRLRGIDDDGRGPKFCTQVLFVPVHHPRGTEWLPPDRYAPPANMRDEFQLLYFQWEEPAQSAFGWLRAHHGGAGASAREFPPFGLDGVR